MFNKIINRDKMIEKINERSMIKLVNSRKEQFGEILYDRAYMHEGYIFFLVDGFIAEHCCKIKLDNILMYDAKEAQLYIKVM